MAQADTEEVYDRIGQTYGRTRWPDARIGARIDEALGDAVTVVNVGAGAGGYEPSDRRVVAVEPSETMIRQRGRNAAPAILGRAEALPLVEGSVDAALAILTVHHWADPLRGLLELGRVARRRVVVLAWDPAFGGRYWINEYFPSIATLDVARCLPLERYSEALGPLQISSVPVPHDCTDGFMAAYWRRPEAYLVEAVRANISSFALLPEPEVEAGVRQLANDLDSGAWEKRHGHLRDLEELDAGYRLVVAELGREP